MARPSLVNPEVDSSDSGGCSGSIFQTIQYIGQMLMEDNVEQQSCMFLDPLVLQAAEKSFYEVLGKKYPLSPSKTPLCIPHTFSSDNGFSGSDATSDSVSQSTFQMPFSSRVRYDGLTDSPVSTLLPSTFGRCESILHFRKGLEEASKFLPYENCPVTDAEAEKGEENLLNSVNGKKKHHRESIDMDTQEERSSKQLAVCGEEDELSEMLDKVFLFPDGNKKPIECNAHENLHNGAGELLQQNGQQKQCSFNIGKGRAKRDGNKNAVDLRTLLIHCAQYITADDWEAAEEKLKQIRQHSSPYGDGSQRSAHYFANGLEARLCGTGAQICAALSSKRPSAVDMLKAYQYFVSVCPFRRISFYFANHHILNLAERRRVLHVIDFGILHGYQWPMFIQDLLSRVGRPPKLRITGIEFPEPGFRPARKVEETGRRLARYCDRFNVPFEYNAIAKKWETIRTSDFKIDRNEVVVVNCLFRLETVFDETVALHSPRNAVLNLIRKINPNIFIHGVYNGSYNASFFVTRFREALFHYSALFDMMDANYTQESQERLMFEKEFFGREAINITACEGSTRILRPETYKQWKVRNTRAGFRQLPLDRELMNTMRAKVKSGYKNDFLVDEDGNWVLQGWKGRILMALSCWVPQDS
ncbi:scarecrow-like protein 14 [Malania oleifera]|uniref:scarecrow-like protein 14 n=1 Tax=Malania oleifera TaxID=397392 RepID=UPI0025AE277F|nr:scarecrow-like protein 14 [Malania oleifera]